MSLRLRSVGETPERSLKIGDEFEDGWKLTGLTSSAATLTRDGVSRTVGLNPTGALGAAEPAAGGSTVTVVTGEPSQARAEDPVFRAQVDDAARSATTTFTDAKAAYEAAAPANKAALFEAMNAAGMAAVSAQNYQVLISEIGAGVATRLPPRVYRPPGSPLSAEDEATIAAARQSGMIRSAQQP
jgi:hypothetical protein